MTSLSLVEDVKPSSFTAVADMPAAALEAIPMAVYVVDAEAHILRFNSKAAELWGRTPKLGDPEDRYCGAHRLFRLNGEFLPHCETPMAAALATGEPQRGAEVTIEREDGGRSIVLVNIEPLFDDAGAVAGAINCFHDISEKKKLEDEVRKGETSLKAIVDTTPECIKIVGADGRLLQMNAAGLRMIGSDCFDTVNGADTYSLIAPEYRKAWQENHARVLAGERLSWEFDIIGLDGVRRHMETHAAPLEMADHKVAQLAVTRDITQRKLDEKAIAASNRLYRETLEALPAAIYTTDANGKLTFYNDAAVEFCGHRPVIGEDSWCVSYRLYWPDGTPMPHDQCPMAAALRERRKSYGETEAVAERPDGTRVPFMPFITPLFDKDGELIGAVNMLVDISEAKRAEERRKIFADELNHRVKNTLAIVQSLAAQTAKRSASVPAFEAAFRTRLRALSKTHELLARSGWEQASLCEMVTQILEPYEGIKADGPAVGFGPSSALSVAMVLNELATNATKHGALSVPNGKVELSWALDASAENLCLKWRESGGPPAAQPVKSGFGLTSIERGIAQGLEGELHLDFTPHGLVCEAQIPMRGNSILVEVLGAA